MKGAFTFNEARQLVGREVMVTQGKPGKRPVDLPCGTAGRVIGYEVYSGSPKHQGRGYDLIIRWKYRVRICGRSEQLVDRVTRQEFEGLHANPI